MGEDSKKIVAKFECREFQILLTSNREDDRWKKIVEKLLGKKFEILKL